MEKQRRADASFPTPIVVKLTGVTDRTLDHWNARGFLKPSVRARGMRRGNAPRVYSFRDLVAICVVEQLRSGGIEVRHLRDIVAYVRSREDLELDVGSDPNQLLITDGQTFVEMDGSAESPEARWPREMPPLLLLISFGRVLNKLRLEARATLAA